MNAKEYEQIVDKMMQKEVLDLHIKLYNFFKDYELLLEEVETEIDYNTSLQLRKKYNEKYNSLKEVEAIVLELLGLQRR